MAIEDIGKYRILGTLGQGGFADVYRGLDTIEGVQVALKIPQIGPDGIDGLLDEVRIAASLVHPNVLAIKSADIIDGQLVVAVPLGVETLADRLQRRIGIALALDYGEQLLAGLAHAHSRRVMHCDVKPANVILFEDGSLRLGDFGIARISWRTISASGSGSLGYIAPEQAMGRPSIRSDVFSAGLVLWRMLSGALPHWPFEWPYPGLERLRTHVDAALIAVLRRATEVSSRKRYASAEEMLAAYQRALPATRRHGQRRVRKKTRRARTPTSPSWHQARFKEFLRHHRGDLPCKLRCAGCEGPIHEAMQSCPWCARKVEPSEPSKDFPASCPRCSRGRKLDWRFCAWCYGAGFDDTATREYTDVRYQGKCEGAGCTRRQLMPWSRYCPWCRRRVRKRWQLQGTSKRCRSCGWGVFPDYWEYCPWCAKEIRRKGRRS